MARPPRPSAPAALTAAAAGDPGSATALRRLGGHLHDIKARALQPLLHKALSALRAGRRDEAAASAAEALKIDPGCGLAWHIKAICQEKSGDFTAALGSYEQALAHMPDEPEIANDLGRLALKMGMPDSAEVLFANYVARRPGSVEGVNNLACAQRDLMKFELAIETLREGIADHPESPLLWNALASVLTLQGEMEQAAVFYDEALRLDGSFPAARYNRAGVRLALGDTPGALADLDAALAAARAPTEAAGMRVARAKALIGSGDLAAGWAAYESRFDPLYEDAVHFLCELPQWSPGMSLEGRRLLVIGEQGLGDEVLFANIVPDLLAAVGDAGRLGLAVEPRLTTLFARSFPKAEVGPHASFRAGHQSIRAAPALGDAFDAWTAMGSPLQQFRPTVESFSQGPFLQADPRRVDYWRAQLEALPGLKVGILWKSLVMDADRSRYFAPWDAWEPVLNAPGATFINLQYGDTAEEAAAAAALGIDLWSPPNIDLKDDLDEVAALAGALDLMIAPANAASNIAAACGVEVWLISTPGSWPRLGTDRYPWYPTVRVFTPHAFARWQPVMQDVAGALRERLRL